MQESNSNHRPGLIIFAVDAADPDLIVNNIDELPNLKQLCLRGTSGKVNSLHFSCDVWTSIYTGLTPEEHKVQYLRLSNPDANRTQDLTGSHYLWNQINARSLSFGMFDGLFCYPSPPIDGFFLGGKPRLGEAYAYPPSIKELLKINIEPVAPEAPNLTSFGVLEPFNEACPEQLQLILNSDYFTYFKDYLSKKLKWYRDQLGILLAHYPVNVLFLYTLDIDLIGHFCQHPGCYHTLVNCYKLFDNFLGDVIQDWQPDNILFVSDHGMQPLSNLFTGLDESNPLRAEYAVTVRSLPDGSYVSPWPPNSFANGTHTNQGFYAASGSVVRSNIKRSISYLQIYPVILQLLNIPLPSHVARLPDIFEPFDETRAESFAKLHWAKDQGLIDKLLTFADLLPNQSVADIGTGTGILANAIKTKGLKVTGIDSSIQMLKKAHERYPDLDVLQGDIMSLPWADNVFDRAIARMVLHHVLEGLPLALKEISRVLKSGGELVVCEGIPPLDELLGEYSAIFSLKERRICFTPSILKELLTESGFSIARESKWVISQVSVKHWLDNGGVVRERQEEIMALHRNATPLFKKAYNLTDQGDDLLIDMTFYLLAGRKHG